MANGGLIGFCKRIFSRSSPSLVMTPVTLMTRLSGLAAVVLIVKKSNLQGISGANWDVVIVALALGLVAVVGEYQFARDAYRAWRERQLSTFALCMSLWAAAFAYSCNNWLSVASEGQVGKASAQKVAFRTATNAHGDRDTAASALIAAQAKEKRIGAERWKPLPKVGGQEIGSAGEAKQIFEAMKANTRFWNLTEQCTKSAGPQTREYVQKCGEAKAAMIASDTREALEDVHQDAIKAVNIAQTTFDKAKQVASVAPVAESDERPDLLLYTSWGGVSAQNAVLGQAVGMIAFVSMLLSGLGLMRERMEFNGQPSKPWPFIAKLKGLVFGKPSAEDQAMATLARDGRVEIHETVTDAREVNRLKDSLRAAFLGDKQATA
jgi:hypothetical protein